MPDNSEVEELLSSHAELRAGLRIAVQRIRNLQFGRRNDDPVIVMVRKLLVDAAKVASVHKKGRRKPGATA